MCDAVEMYFLNSCLLSLHIILPWHDPKDGSCRPQLLLLHFERLPSETGLLLVETESVHKDRYI